MFKSQTCAKFRSKAGQIAYGRSQRQEIKNPGIPRSLLRERANGYSRASDRKLVQSGADARAIFDSARKSRGVVLAIFGELTVKTSSAF